MRGCSTRNQTRVDRQYLLHILAWKAGARRAFSDQGFDLVREFFRVALLFGAATFDRRGFFVDEHYFVPGFPVMAWPMMEWVLDTHYRHLHGQGAQPEKSVIVFGAMEATLTPLMERIETEFAGVKVFSLPSVDHPEYGRHIELGVKGDAALLGPAYDVLLAGLRGHGAKLGPELTR